MNKIKEKGIDKRAEISELQDEVDKVNIVFNSMMDELEVKDNGIGIPENEINNVMKRFYKVDKSRVNNNSFGIGLSIANRIVNKYDAKIHIDSEVDRYTKISIYFK